MEPAGVLLLLRLSGLRSIRSSAAADPKQGHADRCLVETWAKEAQTVVLVQPGNPLQATGKPHLAADCPTTTRPAAAAANRFLGLPTQLPGLTFCTSATTGENVSLQTATDFLHLPSLV